MRKFSISAYLAFLRSKYLNIFMKSTLFLSSVWLCFGGLLLVVEAFVM